ncbi:hypothetical protein ACFY1J_23950 [Streptomyces sp. NPDC001406]|uniref:hypothetical protein n=1 Tax=Streptomyces sp. NPDC001406 TaxID=3364572 RepID=UPI003681A705
MTASLPDSSAVVAVELAQLRGELGTGMAEVKGSLALLVDRSNRSDADLRQLREDTEKEIEALRTEVEALKNRRFPLPVVSALTALAAVVVAVVALFTR